MFYYNRQIVYIDLMEAGHKVRNAGFLKLEETEAAVKWSIRIKGLSDSDTGFFEIRDEIGALVDKILLKRGEGSYQREFDREGSSRGGRYFEEICGIRIALSGVRCLEGGWRPAERKRTGVRPEETGKWEEKRQGGPAQYAGEQEENAAPLKAADVPMAEEQIQESDEEIRSGELPEREQEVCRPASENQRSQALQEKLYEDKWEQLKHIYQTVHPFRDEREYLSIAPKDFVILGKEYQKLVHNSFLLHGYYNYRHIILGKFETEGEEAIYLGVPGVYYEREKMAAEMFGFEAFEGRITPAEPGSFGYYMKRVKI